jgi:hypothetical protein
MHRILDDISAPFLRQIGALSKNFALKVTGELVLSHSASPNYRDHGSLPPNILDEPQAKVALPLLFSLQGK